MDYASLEPGQSLGGRTYPAHRNIFDMVAKHVWNSGFYKPATEATPDDERSFSLRDTAKNIVCKPVTQARLPPARPPIGYSLKCRFLARIGRVCLNKSYVRGWDELGWSGRESEDRREDIKMRPRGFYLFLAAVLGLLWPSYAQATQDGHRKTRGAFTPVYGHNIVCTDPPCPQTSPEVKPP
ncbi:metalloendopeptidase [Branchiostoma belcheri]|nr:metalloendopeptidase [Branchiostoma belcheri]